MAMDGYIRVSRVGGRSGPSYRSPSDQEAIIRQLAAAKGVELGELVREEDVTGSRKVAIDARELGRLVRKVEAGESSGIVVYLVTRFSRDFVDGMAAAQRVRDAGGRIIASDIDTSMTMSRGIMALLLDMAENELDNRRETWRRARAGAAEHGEWIGSTVPVGYTREVVGTQVDRHGRERPKYDGPLLLDEDVAPHVVWAYAARGRGESWNAIRDELARRGLNMSRGAVRTMLRSRAYRGDIVEEGIEPHVGAHPAIVDETTWQAAQIEGKRPGRSGMVAANGILNAGLAVCAACDAPLGIAGSRVPSYRCRNARQEPCSAPATLAVSRVDPVILPQLAERMNAQRDVDADERDIAATRAAAEHAEAAMDNFLAHADIVVLGDRYATEAARYRQAIIDAQAKVETLQTRLAASLFAGVGTDLASAPLDDQRAVARALIERVVIRRSTNGSHDTRDRFEVIWRQEI